METHFKYRLFHTYVYGFQVCSSSASPGINAIFNEAERRQNRYSLVTFVVLNV